MKKRLLCIISLMLTLTSFIPSVVMAEEILPTPTPTVEAVVQSEEPAEINTAFQYKLGENVFTGVSLSHAGNTFDKELTENEIRNSLPSIIENVGGWHCGEGEAVNYEDATATITVTYDGVATPTTEVVAYGESTSKEGWLEKVADKVVELYSSNITNLSVVYDNIRTTGVCQPDVPPQEWGYVITGCNGKIIKSEVFVKDLWTNDAYVVITENGVVTSTKSAPSIYEMTMPDGTVKEMGWMSKDGGAVVSHYYQRDVFGCPVKDVVAENTTTSIAGQTIEAGTVLQYNIKYQNTTANDATVTITDNIPEHTTYVANSATGGGVENSGVLRWTASVESGYTIKVSFKVKVNDNVSDTEITNTATFNDGINNYNTNETKVSVEKDVINYTVTFKGEEGNDKTTTEVVKEGEEPKTTGDDSYCNDVEREFVEWAKEDDGVRDTENGMSPLSLEPITSDTTYVAACEYSAIIHPLNYYNVTYTFRDGDEGTIPASVFSIKKEEAIGTANVPDVTLSTGWVLDGYYIGNTKYTPAELAQIVSTEDIEVEIRTYPDLEGGSCTVTPTESCDATPDTPDGIDDRIEHLVTFVDDDGSLLKKEVVEEGKGATAPTNPSSNDGTFSKWDKDYSNVTSDLEVKAEYTYTVTTSIDTHGAITPGKSNIVKGENFQVKFIVNEGYEIDEVLIDGVKTEITGNTHVFTDIKKNHKISVTTKLIPTPTPTPTPTATPTATPTSTPTSTPTATPTVKPTATPTVTPTVTPTATPAAPATATPATDNSAKSTFVVTFFDCKGNIVRVSRVEYGQNAEAPENYYGLNWDSYYGVTENRNVFPKNCSVTSGYTVPNTGVKGNLTYQYLLGGILLGLLGLVMYSYYADSRDAKEKHHEKSRL